MFMLVLGVTLFCAVHFIPSIGAPIKHALTDRVGENGYKGIFSLLLLVSFALMILGWRSADYAHVYTTSPGLRGVAFALMGVAFVLLVAASLKTRIRRAIRHPQLTAVALWSLAHLLVNGDLRSLILFGGLGVWALLTIIAVNRREGAWIKEPAPAITAEFVLLAVAAAALALTVMIHPWLSGVAIV